MWYNANPLPLWLRRRDSDGAPEPTHRLQLARRDYGNKCKEVAQEEDGQTQTPQTAAEDALAAANEVNFCSDHRLSLAQFRPTHHGTAGCAGRYAHLSPGLAEGFGHLRSEIAGGAHATDAPLGAPPLFLYAMVQVFLSSGRLWRHCRQRWLPLASASAMRRPRSRLGAVHGRLIVTRTLESVVPD
jgi:hypothetical protein